MFGTIYSSSAAVFTLSYLPTGGTDWGEMTTDDPVVWIYDSQYGAVGKKQGGVTGHLYTPVLNLDGVSAVMLSFWHAHKFAGTPNSELTLWVTKDYKGSWATSEWQKLTISPYTSNKNWEYSQVTINVAPEYVGANTVFAFQYTSTESNYATWEIKSLKIRLTYSPEQTGDLCYLLDSSNKTATVTSQNTKSPYWSTEITTADIPESISFNGDNYAVTCIGENAFYECKNLSSVTIPNTITGIKKKAFYTCKALTEISLPGSVEYIEEDAFYLCGLTSITMSEGLVNIRSEAFQSCHELTSVVIPNSVKSIGTYAFAYCNKLITVTIPANITSLGTNAFYECKNLKNIVWNAKKCKDFTTADNAPFKSALTKISSFSFGDEVENIPAYLCAGMTSLKEITIPASVQSIGTDAFDGCTQISKVDISNIAAWCGFEFTTSNMLLQHAELYVNGVQPKEIDIPDGVTTIAHHSFLGCTKLAKVTTPSSVTEIGQGAFKNGNRLQTIVLGAGIETIADSAFANCPYLITVHAQMEFPPIIDASVFADCGDLSGVDCYVPTESMAFYRKTAVWKEFNLQDEKTPTARDETSAFRSSSKIIRNGQLFILREGKSYSVQGMEVR